MSNYRSQVIWHICKSSETETNRTACHWMRNQISRTKNQWGRSWLTLLDNAVEYAKIKPDIVPIAKGIGGGFPIGACLVNKKVASTMKPGSHGTTFGGNPLAMSVGNAVLDVIYKKNFLKNVRNLGKYFKGKLNGNDLINDPLRTGGLYFPENKLYKDNA